MARQGLRAAARRQDAAGEVAGGGDRAPMRDRGAADLAYLLGNKMICKKSVEKKNKKWGVGVRWGVTDFRLSFAGEGACRVGSGCSWFSFDFTLLREIICKGA